MRCRPHVRRLQEPLHRPNKKDEFWKLATSDAYDGVEIDFMDGKLESFLIVKRGVPGKHMLGLIRSLGALHSLLQGSVAATHSEKRVTRSSNGDVVPFEQDHAFAAPNNVSAINTLSPLPFHCKH